MIANRSTWLWLGAVLVASAVAYEAGAHSSSSRGLAPSEPAPQSRPDDVLPPAVENWGDQIGASVYIIRSVEPPRMEADADLHARVNRFLEPPVIKAARVYAPEGPESPKGPTDVYLVWDPGDVRSQLHGIEWFDPPGNPSEVGLHRIYPLSLGGCDGLVFLDVDGDGRREVITSQPGVNQWTVAIVDLFAPDGAVSKDQGLPLTKSEWWKFADLDKDGVYEAITAGPAWDVEGLTERSANQRRVFAVYSLCNGRWSLASVHDSDPTVGR